MAENSLAAPAAIPAAIVAPQDATASTLFGVYDGLMSAGRDWPLIVTGTVGQSLFDARIVARNGEPFLTGAGVMVHPHVSYDTCPTPRLIVIPDIFVAPDEDISGRFDPEIEWVTDCYRSGAVVATACTGSLLLAEGGLLDGEDAAIHWGYCNAMAHRYPRINVQPNRALVAAGDGQRLVMAGGGTSWQDLTLYLIARMTSVEEAMRVARLYLIDWHDQGQQPFAVLARSRQVSDAVIARCQEWIAVNYEDASPVTSMAELSGLSERSFKRRFSRATGMSPLEYVQTLRIEEAKQVLETSDDSIESVANQVGYEDASFFGRLFRRRVGMTPARYRKRFQGLRRALERETEVA